MDSFHLLRPWALAAIPLAFVLLAWLMRPLRPERVVLGTYEWLDADIREAQSARGSRRSLPPFAVFAALAVVAASLAASGPRWGAPPEPARWTVVVDPRPAMRLPLETETRAERGARSAAEWLASNAEPGDVVLWKLGAEEPQELALGAVPDSLSSLDGTTFDPREHDAPGTIVVTDLAPEEPLERAGWIATGAEPTPGVLGAEEGLIVSWDGSEVLRGPARSSPRDVVVEPGVDEDLQSLVRLWAASRALRVVPAAADRDVALFVETLAGEPSNGRVSFAGEGELLRGDPALVAVAVGRRLDAAVRPIAGAVDLLSRSRSGASSERAPTPPERRPGTRDADRVLPAWLAALAAVLAVAAWTLYAGSRSVASTRSSVRSRSTSP